MLALTDDKDTNETDKKQQQQQQMGNKADRDKDHHPEERDEFNENPSYATRDSYQQRSGHAKLQQTTLNMITHRILTFRITMISIIILRIMTLSIINFVKGLPAQIHM